MTDYIGNTKTCVNCGHENPDNYRFYEKCGAAFSEVKEQKSRKKLVGIICIAIFTLLVACGTLIYSNMSGGGSATKEEAAKKAIDASINGDLDEMIKAAMPKDYEDIVMEEALSFAEVSNDELIEFMETVSDECSKKATAYFDGEISADNIYLKKVYSMKEAINEYENVRGIDFNINSIWYEQVYLNYVGSHDEYCTDVIVYSIDDKWYAIDNRIISEIIDNVDML